MSVTAADLAQARDDVPAAAAKIAERRAAIEAQHDRWAALQARAVRVSVSGLCFDLGGGHILRWESVADGPTPVGSSILYLASVLPTREEDVEDFHGGWASR